MKKSILIIYPFQNHRNLMISFTQKLCTKGFNVDVICINDLHFIRKSHIKWGKIANRIMELYKPNTIIGRVLRAIFLRVIIYKIMLKYDLIDFHAFVEYDLKLAKYCHKKGIQYDISLWGSDLMRADKNRIQRMKVGFDGCRYIKTTDNLLELLTSKYSGLYNSKKKVVYFGNNDYEIIDKLTTEEIHCIKNIMYEKSTKGKIIVVCGYNGSEFQNHVLMIQAFNKLTEKYCTQVHLVFPMTYGATSKYINIIKELLLQSKYTYTIFDKYMPSKEVAIIRKTADLVVNIQKTDAFSSSLQGHLYCNNVLLIGEWLHYTALQKENVFYLKTSLDDLSENIQNAIVNLDYYKKKCQGNHEKMKKLTSWNSVIDNWATAYDK